jgi:hypothetical protein
MQAGYSATYLLHDKHTPGTDTPYPPADGSAVPNCSQTQKNNIAINFHCRAIVERSYNEILYMYESQEGERERLTLVRPRNCSSPSA